VAARSPLRPEVSVPVPPLAVPSRRTRVALGVPAVVLAVATVAGCGGGSGSAAGGSTAAATSAAGATSVTLSASPGAGRANGFTAYLACLRQHGVTIPTRPPGAARPSGAPRSRGAGGFGFGGAFATSGPAAAAAKACVALRPAGGFGAGLSNNAQLQSELTAYRGCLSDHGVVLPTPAAPGSGAPPAGASGGPGRRGGFGGLGALNTADPKTAAAVKACAPLRPTFGGRGGAAPTPTATPST